MVKHRVLIIGVGSIGERHLRCFGRTGRADLTFCEINQDLRNTIAERYQVAKHFPDLDAALRDRYDAAVVCAPAHLHVQMATTLVEAGIHVLCEKPLSTSLDGVDELIKGAAARGLTTGVGYTWRCNPAFGDARAAIASGRFGKPVQIVFVAGSPFPFHRPAYREIYYNNRATGGGAIQDAITHIINAGEWLAGPVDRLAADAAHQVLDGVDVEDTVHVITRQGRVMGSYTLNQYQPVNDMSATVVCENATVRIEGPKTRWRWVEKPQQPWNDVTFAAPERDDLYIKQANVFLNAVEGKGSVTCTLEEGLQTLRVNLAILEAADRHTWQTVRPGQ